MGTVNENADLELDIALKSTGGNTEKALAMLSGEYFDCAVLKGTFLLQDSKHSGLVLIFFNTANDYIPFIDSVVFKNPAIYEQIDAASEWKTVLQALNNLKQEKDASDTPEINDKIVNEIFEMDFFLSVKTGNIDSMENIMKTILRRVLGNQPISCNLSIEQISSLTMSKENIPFEKPFSEISHGTNQETEVESIMQNIEKQVKFVLEGNAVIAPVKGKFIADVQIGDEILIIIADKDQTSKNILTSLKAIDEDEIISPVPGKVVQKINLPETRNIIIYALVAKGVLVKLVEDNSLKIIDETMHKISVDEITIPLKIALFIIVSVVIITVILLV